MELSPQKLRSMSFSTAKKGYDRTEVDAFVGEVATALENAQNETTAMEARARAAIARLKEVTEESASPADEAPQAGEGTDAERPAAELSASPDEAETISRTLLLAQRTADATIADASSEAEQMIAEAREQARLALEEDRIKAEQEVTDLRGRRDVLETDVEQLEEFLIAQRDRLRSAASELVELVDRVPDGLGQARPPMLSADDSDDVAVVADDEEEVVATHAADGFVPVDDVPTADDSVPTEVTHEPGAAALDDEMGDDDGASSSPRFEFGVTTDEASGEEHR